MIKRFFGANLGPQNFVKDHVKLPCKNIFVKVKKICVVSVDIWVVLLRFVQSTRNLVYIAH